MSRKYRIDTIDMMGKRSGKLVVTQYYPRDDKRGAYWLCKCDCGNETIASGGSLRKSGTKQRKSCGCLSTDNLEQTGIHWIMYSYKAKAKKRNIKFLLDDASFAKLVKGNCFYCGVIPSQKLMRQKNKKKVQIVYNGIDRKDTKGDYSIENCVSCCFNCNRAKATQSVDEFKSLIERIYKCLRIGSL